MDRKKVIEALLRKAEHEELLRNALRYLADTNLLAFALEYGVTEDDLSVIEKEWQYQFCSVHTQVQFKNQSEKDAHLATHEWKPLQKGLGV